MWRHPYFQGFLYISGRSGNVFSDCGAKDTVLLDLSIAVRYWERHASTMSNSANYNATVQVLLELGDLAALQNTGVSTFQEFWMYTNICKYIRSVCNIHCRWPLYGVSVGQGSTIYVYIVYWKCKWWVWDLQNWHFLYQLGFWNTQLCNHQDAWST